MGLICQHGNEYVVTKGREGTVDVKMYNCIGNELILLVHFQLHAVGTRGGMLVKILLHSNPAVVCFKLGYSLRQGMSGFHFRN